MTVDAAFAEAAGDLILEFAPAATYTPPVGAAVVTVCAVEHVARPRLDAMSIERVTLARMPAAAVPDPKRGGTIVIGADTWIVEALDADDKTVVTVVVKRAP